jgi:hypothetical protein
MLLVAPAPRPSTQAMASSPRTASSLVLARRFTFALLHDVHVHLMMSGVCSHAHIASCCIVIVFVVAAIIFLHICSPK